MWAGSHLDTSLQHIKHYPWLDRVKQRPGASAWCTEAENSGTETNGRCSEPRTGSWNQMHVAETKKGRRNQQAQARARQTLLCIVHLLGAIAWSCCLGHVLGAKAGITRGGKRGERTPPRLGRAKHFAHALARQCSTWSIWDYPCYHLAWNCSRSCHVI